MTNAICIEQNGGPEVLEYKSVTVGKPGQGEVRIRHTAIGLDFIDVYHRTGLYPVPTPFIPGLEGAGVVEEIGGGVSHLNVGDRVCYPAGPLGSYSQARIMPAERLVKTPDYLSDEDAAAIMLKGCTVEYLTHRTYKVEKGDTVLFHAAAGGVGLLACQWLNALGVTVIGTVGSDEKAALAKANGCHHTINYTSEDFTARVREITDGKGVPVVYDSVGKDTFMGSLDCLQTRGTMVTFGNATGAVPAFEPGLLNQKGGLYITRPSLMHYAASQQDLELSTGRVFEAVKSGALKVAINQRFDLSDAAEAHRTLEARKTTGQTILMP